MRVRRYQVTLPEPVAVWLETHAAQAGWSAEYLIANLLRHCYRQMKAPRPQRWRTGQDWREEPPG